MILAALALLLLTPAATAAPQDSTRIDEILASGDGKTEETAYKVRGVNEEYLVIRSLGFRPREQALLTKDGKAWDLMTVTDPKTHKKIEIYFDISSFFGKEFGL
jgi:hypothetical protein